MWIKNEFVGPQTLMHKMCRWEYAPPSEEIRRDKETLEIDVVKLDNRGAYYIVAVVHEGSNRVVPIPLGELEILNTLYNLMKWAFLHRPF
jgi:hypothetical protein